MTLLPEIVEVSRDTQTGNVYVLVNFYAVRGGPVMLTEEFVMQLRETRTRHLFDRNGDVIGTEEVPVDARAEMRANIARFAERAEASGWVGDMTQGPPGQRSRARDDIDTDGKIARLRMDAQRVRP